LRAPWGRSETSKGSLAAVGVLGEFGPLSGTPTRGPGEDKRAVDALER